MTTRTTFCLRRQLPSAGAKFLPVNDQRSKKVVQVLRRAKRQSRAVLVVVNLKHAALHEEGGYEGGDDRQDEVADLIGGNVFEDSHFCLKL